MPVFVGWVISERLPALVTVPGTALASEEVGAGVWWSLSPCSIKITFFFFLFEDNKAATCCN